MQVDQNFTVGFALRLNKAEKHVSNKLIEACKGQGIEIRILDEFVPLEEQGHLDVILQKIRRKEWEDDLMRYWQQHPHVQIVDLPALTYPLRNRGTMLTPFSGPGWVCESPSDAPSPCRIRCSVPVHTTLEAGIDFAAAKAQLEQLGMRHPILAKSLWADGRESSHTMAVISSDEGLRQLVNGEAPEGFGPPVLIEQYVDHGTCLFKVYVLGDETVMVTRPSLNLSLEEHRLAELTAAAVGEESATTRAAAIPIDIATAGVNQNHDHFLCGSSPPVPSAEEIAAAAVPPPPLELISRVSAYPRCRSWGKGDLAPKDHGVPVPPEWLWRDVARRIRQQLGLSMFNFDLIVPLSPPLEQSGLLHSGSSNVVKEGLVHLIDINYFPGFEKLPGYEDLIVGFLNRLRQQHGQAAAAATAT